VSNENILKLRQFIESVSEKRVKLAKDLIDEYIMAAERKVD